MDLAPGTIQEGDTVDLTFFRPNAQWTPQPADLRSRSRNNPMLGQPLTGTVEGVYARGRFIRHAQAVHA
jgi:dihydroorotase-like cyclic amidohydrolase